MTRLRRFLWPWGLLILLTLFVYFWNLGSYGLIDPDEGRYAEIPREMIESGDFITPRLNYVKYFEKPVLHYWLTAGAFMLFGQNEAAARLTPVLLGLGGCLLTYLLGWKVTGSRRGGGLAAMVLASSVLWFALSRLNITDMTLTFFFTLALLGYYLWFDGERAKLELTQADSPDQLLLFPLERHCKLWLLIFYAGMALATLSKGLIGVVLPGGIAVLHLAFLKRRRALLPRLFSPAAIGLYFLITVPWFWAVCRANPDFFQFFFIREHFLRYLTTVHEHYEPFWYFVPMILLAFVPWTGMLLDAFHALRGKWSILAREEGLFLGLWFAAPFAFFSFSSSKLIPYILPCMPPVAVLIGTAMEMTLQGRSGSRRMILRFIGLNALIVLPLVAAGLLGPRFNEDLTGAVWPLRGLALCLLAFWGATFFLLRQKRRWVPVLLCVLALGILWAASPAFNLVACQNSRRDSALMARERLGDAEAVVAWQNLMQGLPFYLKRRVVVADTLNELEFGAAQETDPRWFISPAQLRSLWNGPRRVLLVSRRKNLDALRKTLGRRAARVGESAEDVLFTNF